MTFSRALVGYIAALLLQVPMIGAILGSAGTIVYAALDVAFFCLVTLLLLSKGRAPALSPAAKAVLSLFLYAAISSFWTASTDLPYGLALLTRDFARFWNLVAAVSLIGVSEFRQALARAVRVAAILYPVLALPTMSLRADFEGAEGRLMYGGYKDANPVARDLGLILILYYWASKAVFRLSALAIFALLVLAGLFLAVFSKTATLGMLSAIAGAGYFYNSGLGRKVKGTIVVVAAAGIVLALKFEYLLQYLTSVQSGSALETLSGRTLIWDLVLDKIGAQLLFGFGLNSFGAFSLAALENVPQQAHNEVFQIGFSYGLPGLLILLWLWRSFFRAGKRATSSDGRLIVAISVFYLIIGLTEANIVTTVAPIWLITALSYLGPRRTLSPERPTWQVRRESAVPRVAT